VCKLSYFLFNISISKESFVCNRRKVVK